MLAPVTDCVEFGLQCSHAVGMKTSGAYRFVGEIDFLDVHLGAAASPSDFAFPPVGRYTTGDGQGPHVVDLLDSLSVAMGGAAIRGGIAVLPGGSSGVSSPRAVLLQAAAPADEPAPPFSVMIAAAQTSGTSGYLFALSTVVAGIDGGAAVRRTLALLSTPAGVFLYHLAADVGFGESADDSTEVLFQVAPAVFADGARHRIMFTARPGVATLVADDVVVAEWVLSHWPSGGAAESVLLIGARASESIGPAGVDVPVRSFSGVISRADLLTGAALDHDPTEPLA